MQIIRRIVAYLIAYFNTKIVKEKMRILVGTSVINFGQSDSINYAIWSLAEWKSLTHNDTPGDIVVHKIASPHSECE